MSQIATALRQAEQALLELRAVATDETLASLTDGGVISGLSQVGRVQRMLDGVRAGMVAQAVERDGGLASEALTTVAGCRDVPELLERAWAVDRAEALRWQRAGWAVRRERGLSSGALLPARFPALAQALAEGVVSISGFLAATGPLEHAHGRLGPGELAEADEMLAKAARGIDLAKREPADAADARAVPVASAEDLRMLSARIVTLLDPDGAEPADVLAQRGRYLTLGRVRDGSVPVRGNLLPEVAGQLRRLMESESKAEIDGSGGDGPGSNPSGADGVRFIDSVRADAADHAEPCEADADTRTPAQRRHDAFASILSVAAASGSMHRIGGAAPTLVVSVTAADFETGGGAAVIENTGEQVSVAVARQVACAGGVQRVLFDQRGRIVSIGTSGRLFTALQRRAIVLRDRECLIPGCHVSADWCEIHHVTEHAAGGPTHTDNGVPLCWWHHRTIESSGWEIRMQRGVPEVRGPSWWDRARRWRRPRHTLAVPELVSARGG